MYESRKIQGVALPQKERTGQIGQSPIMGRITVNRTMAQFGCKLSCTPELWNPRESRLNGKSKEAVEINAKIEKLLLAVNTAFDSLVERKVDFDATDVKDLFQGSMETQMTLMKMTDAICDDIKARIGIDRAKGTYPGYHYMRLALGEFIETKYKVKDLAFGQLTEQFIHDYQSSSRKIKLCDRYRPPPPCHPEENLPHCLQERIFGEMPFPTFRPATAIRKDSTGIEPRIVRKNP